MLNETPTPPTTFRTFILRTAQLTLDAIQSAPAILTPAERDQALHMLSFCLKLEDAWHFTRDILLQLAPKMEMMGHRYDWMPYLERGIEICINHADQKNAAELQLQLGILYRMVSEYEKAKQILQASVENFVIAGEKRGEARSLNELAWVEHLGHYYRDAIIHANSALQMLVHDDPERGMSYRTLGMVAFFQKDLSLAEVYHRQALSIFEASGDRQKAAWSLQNIGMALRDDSRYKEAIEYFSKASTILEDIQDISRWSMIQIGMGTTYYYAGETWLAIDCYKRAEAIATRLYDRLQLAMIQGNLGLAFAALSQYAEASEHFENAISRYRAIGDKVWTLHTMEGLASCQIKQYLFDDASVILAQAIELLPQVIDSPHYENLKESLQKHRESIAGSLLV